MTSQIQRGLTRFRTWSHTRWCLVVVVFFLFCLFFFHNGSVTHIFAHTCTRTQTDICYRPQTRHTKGGRRGFETRHSPIQTWHAGSHGSASAQRFKHPAPGIAVLGLLRADWHRATPVSPHLTHCLPSLLLPPPKNRARAESDKMSAPSGRFDILHPSPLSCSSLMTLCWNVRPISSFPSDI